MKIPRNRQKFNIDVESLPTIINLNNVPSQSSTPEDSGLERSSGSANSEDINMRKCSAFCKDDSHSDHGKENNNGIFTVVSASPDTHLYDEGYYDLAKKTILLERQTPL